MMKQEKKPKVIKRVFKIAAIILAVVIILPLIVIYSVRGVNALRFNIRGGVQERYYVTLGGIEQAIHIRGQSVNNPVIIWLHGGPGWNDTYNLSSFQYQMEHEYTFIRWDQRGAGRTYYRNPDALLSLDILVSDLNDLVDYATERFGQPIYIVGHSWGSILGITYASQHPGKIVGFIGVGQDINIAETTRLAVEAGIERATAAGNFDDVEQMLDIYEKMRDKGFSDSDYDFYDFAIAQGLPGKYLTPKGENVVWDSMFSPYFGFTEQRQLISLMTNIYFNFDRNRPLFNAIDMFTPPDQLEVPVAFIMGSEDYVTNTALVIDYYNIVDAPSKSVFIIEGAGHNLMLSQPDVFAQKLREALMGLSN